MSDDPVPLISIPEKSALGDRIRGIANHLRQESAIQIKATSRILGAAAQIAQNHDRLIDEVVEMVEEDLEQQAQAAESYTAEKLQQQFKTLKAAKAHFDVKASSWVALAVKLNKQVARSRSSTPSTPDSVLQRLEAIEREVKTVQEGMSQVLNLLNLIAEKLL